MKRFIILMVITLLSTASFGQVRGGNIYGTVVSSAGERLPGVTIALTPDNVGASQLQVTNSSGQFRFLGLPPSTYELKFELDGFQTVLREGVQVNLGQSVTLNIPMEIASTNSPPDCSAASADPATFWPPNRKFNEVEVIGLNDPDGDPITVTITGITQDEPVDGNRTAPDGDGIGTSAARIRAERDGRGNGRIYVISFDAADDEGATCEGAVQVCVSNRGECIDDGQDYGSVD